MWICYKYTFLHLRSSIDDCKKPTECDCVSEHTCWLTGHPEESQSFGAAVGERARGTDQLHEGEARAGNEDHQPPRGGLQVGRPRPAHQGQERPQTNQSPPQRRTIAN